MTLNFQFAKLQRPRPYQGYAIDPPPSDWATLDRVDWSKEVHVEVGSGKGHWIHQEAQKNPNHFYIGIERTLNKSKCLNQHVLENLITLRADAIPLIAHKVPQESINSLYFFYPNPTPKLSQANQRFFVSSSFSVFLKALKPKGQVYLATNIKDYYLEAESFLKTIWGFDIVKSGQILDKNIQRTAFEKKYAEQGEDLWELIARKNDSDSPKKGKNLIFSIY